MNLVTGGQKTWQRAVEKMFSQHNINFTPAHVTSFSEGTSGPRVFAMIGIIDVGCYTPNIKKGWYYTLEEANVPPPAKKDMRKPKPLELPKAVTLAIGRFDRAAQNQGFMQEYGVGSDVDASVKRYKAAKSSLEKAISEAIYNAVPSRSAFSLRSELE